MSTRVKTSGKIILCLEVGDHSPNTACVIIFWIVRLGAKATQSRDSVALRHGGRRWEESTKTGLCSLIKRAAPQGTARSDPRSCLDVRDAASMDTMVGGTMVTSLIWYFSIEARNRGKSKRRST